ncbi:DUF4261 domain-containing protein [Dysgonomonas macrotermitis]|uniref:DUF4261 domain-containing protein n=1 Tax=Dysgonomonas macrotermitis TaxID=1346286 RepID=A0A1M5AQ92_9BACT|nr:DUF4261 domain-containing protein [Dysgonomonas macrotermitis]SHF32344.1 protein of unknown function [Dysgonomonas macrotermitis]
MGLFDFFKKKKNTEQVKPESERSTLAMAMPMFSDGKSFDMNKVVEHLQSFWQLSVTDFSGDSNETAVFNVDGHLVALADMLVPIPLEELNEIIRFTYLWKNAGEETSRHTGHALVTVMGNNGTEVERRTLLSKLLCSIMLTTPECIGIYQGNETLLLQRDFYLAAVEDLQNNRIPVPAWIYIGLRGTDKGIDAYTFGMKSFNKPEFEVIGTPLDHDQLYTLILSIVSYTLGNDVTFGNGDTFSLSENASMRITASKGRYIDDITLKLDM